MSYSLYLAKLVLLMSPSSTLCYSVFLLICLAALVYICNLLSFTLPPFLNLCFYLL